MPAAVSVAPLMVAKRSTSRVVRRSGVPGGGGGQSTVPSCGFEDHLIRQRTLQVHRGAHLGKEIVGKRCLSSPGNRTGSERRG